MTASRKEVSYNSFNKNRISLLAIEETLGPQLNRSIDAYARPLGTRALASSYFFCIVAALMNCAESF